MNEGNLNSPIENGKLNDEQKWHLNKEGLGACIRNQLGNFENLRDIIEKYETFDEEKKEGVFNLIKNDYPHLVNTFDHLRALATEAGRSDIGTEIEKLAPFVESIRKMVEEDAEFDGDVSQYKEVIQTIIEISEKEY